MKNTRWFLHHPCHPIWNVNFINQDIFDSIKFHKHFISATPPHRLARLFLRVSFNKADCKRFLYEWVARREAISDLLWQSNNSIKIIWKYMYHMLFKQHSWSIIFINWTGNKVWMLVRIRAFFSSSCLECSY